MVDSSVIKRQHQRQLPSHKYKRGIGRRRLQHLCLDKAYNSKPEEQELIKRGYLRTAHTIQEKEMEGSC